MGVREFFQKRVVQVIANQLRQGVAPEKLALSFALGTAIALFPLIGTTTLLALAIGHWRKLNHPVLQLVNYFLYPVQILMVPVWVWSGETLFQVPHVPLNPLTLVQEFRDGPANFLRLYGMAGLQAIAAWSLTFLWLGPILYYVFRSVFQRLDRKRKGATWKVSDSVSSS